MKKLILFTLLFILRLSLSAQISVEDLWQLGKYRAKYFYHPNWVGTGANYLHTQVEKEGDFPTVTLYHASEGIVKELTEKKPKDYPSDIEWGDCVAGPDYKYLLFPVNEESIYRRSSKANYYLYETATGSLVPLTDFAKGKISALEFSPDGEKVGFVRDNNLYMLRVSSLKEKALTEDGKFNFIINGLCDWVYEEEFEFTKAWYWSPDSKNILCYRFDESKVKEYTMQVWNGLYPEDYRYKYPKAGEANSIVSLLCIDVESNGTVEIDRTVPGEKEYFPRAGWTGKNNVLYYYRMNRLQNNVEILHYDLQTKLAKAVYKEADKAYVEITDNHFYLKNAEDFVFTSESSGYRHLYLNQNNSSLALTSGNYEVSEIAGIDVEKGLVYYLAQEDSPLEKHLYVLNLESKEKRKLTQQEGVYDVSFSSDYTYFTEMHSSIHRPYSMKMREAASGIEVLTLGNNGELMEKIKVEKLPPIEFIKFKTSQGTALNGWILKPSGMKKKKKYPVLLTIYGGPGHQEVMNSWKGANYFWYQMLAQKGYVVVCVDGRGTGGRGVEFKKCTQGNLGKYETEDLIETAKYLGNLPFIDKERIGIFGWSFGGYLSSLAITKGTDYFKTAIAVAPVTNWRYYDNIYTERYMGLPQENENGYDENAPMNYAKQLKGNYLLIHGTADDNVHVQHSLEMQRALIEAGKQFEVFYYPDRNHGIYGGLTRYHLYKMMTEFILKKL